MMRSREKMVSQMSVELGEGSREWKSEDASISDGTTGLG